MLVSMDCIIIYGILKALIFDQNEQPYCSNMNFWGTLESGIITLKLLITIRIIYFLVLYIFCSGASSHSCC